MRSVPRATVGPDLIITDGILSRHKKIAMISVLQVLVITAIQAVGLSLLPTSSPRVLLYPNAPKASATRPAPYFSTPRHKAELHVVVLRQQAEENTATQWEEQLVLQLTQIKTRPQAGQELREASAPRPWKCSTKPVACYHRGCAVLQGLRATLLCCCDFWFASHPAVTLLLPRPMVWGRWL